VAELLLEVVAYEQFASVDREERPHCSSPPGRMLVAIGACELRFAAD
jgi:hypothetical protein